MTAPRPWPPAAWLPFALLAAALGVYALLLPWHSLDADHWFVPWLEQMTRRGPWHALGQPMQVETEGAAGYANYNPPYLYLLAAASLLSPALGSLALVKLVAVAGTLFCAGAVLVLLRPLVPSGRAAAGAACVSLLPTVALNGAGWGQTDAIYAGLLVLLVAAAVAERPAASMLAFGAALAFKLPAVFLGPFVLYLVLSRRVPLRCVPLAPLAYLASLVPALLAGQDPGALARIYLDQAGTYHWLSMKAPNPWSVVQALGMVPYDEGVLAGTALAAAAGLALTLLALRWRPAGRDLVLFATLCAVLMPFLLPKMHDRYFFAADVLGFAYALVAPGRRSAAAAACIEAGSLAAYGSILFGIRAGPAVGAVAMTVAAVLLGSLLADALGRNAGLSVSPRLVRT